MALIVYPNTKAHPLFQKNPTAVFAASPYHAQREASMLTANWCESDWEIGVAAE
jgi:hypothetical protein